MTVGPPPPSPLTPQPPLDPSAVSSPPLSQPQEVDVPSAPAPPVKKGVRFNIPDASVEDPIEPPKFEPNSTAQPTKSIFKKAKIEDPSTPVPASTTRVVKGVMGTLTPFNAASVAKYTPPNYFTINGQRFEVSTLKVKDQIIDIRQAVNEYNGSPPNRVKIANLEDAFKILEASLNELHAGQTKTFGQANIGPQTSMSLNVSQENIELNVRNPGANITTINCVPSRTLSTRIGVLTLDAGVSPIRSSALPISSPGASPLMMFPPGMLPRAPVPSSAAPPSSPASASHTPVRVSPSEVSPASVTPVPAAVTPLASSLERLRAVMDKMKQHALENFGEQDAKKYCELIEYKFALHKAYHEAAASDSEEECKEIDGTLSDLATTDEHEVFFAHLIDKDFLLFQEYGRALTDVSNSIFQQAGFFDPKNLDFESMKLEVEDLNQKIQLLKNQENRETLLSLLYQLVDAYQVLRDAHPNGIDVSKITESDPFFLIRERIIYFMEGKEGKIEVTSAFRKLEARMTDVLTDPSSLTPAVEDPSELQQVDDAGNDENQPGLELPPLPSVSSPKPQDDQGEIPT